MRTAPMVTRATFLTTSSWTVSPSSSRSSTSSCGSSSTMAATSTSTARSCALRCRAMSVRAPGGRRDVVESEHRDQQGHERGDRADRR